MKTQRKKICYHKLFFRNSFFLELTDTLLTAQAFAFFFAGFDTSSTTISHILYELAINQSIQNKLREEVNNILLKNNGKIEFTMIQEMKYLNKVFNGRDFARFIIKNVCQ
jgi:cytochrome P450